MRRRISRLLRETGRTLAAAADLVEDAAGLNRVEKRTDFARCERPVLLLYGFFSTRQTFDVLERRLRRDGYGVFSLNLGGLWPSFNTRGIDDLADLVRAKVERIYARNPARRRASSAASARPPRPPRCSRAGPPGSGADAPRIGDSGGGGACPRSARGGGGLSPAAGETAGEIRLRRVVPRATHHRAGVPSAARLESGA